MAIVCVILSGISNRNKIARCQNLEKQLHEICNQKSENPLFKRLDFSFSNRGAFSYSQELREAFGILYQSCSSYIEKVGISGEMLVHPNFIKLAEMTRDRTDITESEYALLQELGKKVKVEKYYVESQE